MVRPVLEFREVSKSFFGVRVLRQVSFSLPAGQVLGLVGENGAGKSTLMNILGGILPADAGEILLGGVGYAPRAPADAAQAGIALVHQELNLFANLSIAENIFLTDFPRRRLAGIPWIDRRRLRLETSRLLASVGLSLDPGRLVEELSPGERQLVEIAKGLRAAARIVVFDEPTTSLSEREAQRLLEIIARLRQEGISMIYISHNLGDVLRLCDQIVVLRDGAVQAAAARGEFTLDHIISLMVGRSLEQLYPPRHSGPANEKVLQVRGLSQPGVIEDIHFDLRRGELLGIAGLMGSGRTELARILFGLDPHERGEVLLRGRLLQRPSPRECMRRGMALLTENRREEGLLMEASVEDNIVLASLGEFATAGFLDRPRLKRAARETAASLGIECPAIERRMAKTLSGGNQQKAVLAKWLLKRPAVFILDEPTRGLTWAPSSRSIA